MRAHGTGREPVIQIQLESRVWLHVVAVYSSYMNFVIPFRMDLAEGILVEEVVRDDQALFIFGESKIVRAGAGTQIQRYVRASEALAQATAAAVNVLWLDEQLAEAREALGLDPGSTLSNRDPRDLTSLGYASAVAGDAAPRRSPFRSLLTGIGLKA